MIAAADDQALIARVIKWLQRPGDGHDGVAGENSLALSETEKSILRDVLVAHEEMHMSSISSGRLQLAIVRLLMRVRDAAQSLRYRDMPGSRSLLDMSNVIAYGVRSTPRRLGPWLGRQVAMRKVTKTSAELLRKKIYQANLPMHRLLECVADMPQNRDCPAFEMDEKRHIVVGTVIGFDVLHCADDFTVVEANSGIGQQPQWLLEGDFNPFIDGIFRFADQHRFRHIQVINNDRGLQGRQETQYREAAARSGISVAIVEPASTYVATRWRSSTMPTIDRRDTLCVRIRDFPSWPDYQMSNKLQVQQSLQSFFDSNGITGVRVPDTRAGWLERIDWDSGRFPNLVAKLPDADGGVGVTFYKARNIEHARQLVADGQRRSSSRIGGILGAAMRRSHDNQVLLQPYEKSRLFDGDRLAIYRLNVLVAPLANAMLSATKYTASQPAPGELPHGVVRDPTPFLVNGGVGALRSHPDDSEMAVLAPVADVLGHAMSSLLRAHFRTARSGNNQAAA